MQRRKYHYYLHGLLLVVVTGFCDVVQAQKKQGKPNIIFLLADDLGYGDIGPYGQQKIQMANLNRLAKLGT